MPENVGELTYLLFKDGKLAFYADDDRKRHVMVRPGQIMEFNCILKCVKSKTLMVTYEQWKNRWVK